MNICSLNVLLFFQFGCSSKHDQHRISVRLQCIPLATRLKNHTSLQQLETNIIERLFDDLLFQSIRGKVTHEQIEKGIRYDAFEQVKEWHLKYGYKFSIYGNDHFIDGKAHFHFDNISSEIFCKIDFDGNILEEKGKNTIPKNVYNELLYFLSKDHNKSILKGMWNNRNPSLVI